MEKKTDIKNTAAQTLPEKLKAMRWGMIRTKIGLYFLRNNLRIKTYYYNRFIEIIGLETWKNLDSYYKNSWNEAKNSFDRMYGIIKAWQNIEEFPVCDKDVEAAYARLSEAVEKLASAYGKETERIEKNDLLFTGLTDAAKTILDSTSEKGGTLTSAFASAGISGLNDNIKIIETISSGIALRNIAAETAKKLDEANSKKDADNKTTDTEEEKKPENAEAGTKKEDGDGPDKS